MSSTLYSLCREICPPSGIDHAVTGRITAPNARNLIVARGNLLQLFLVLEDADVSQSALSANHTTTRTNDLDLPDLEPLRPENHSILPPTTTRVELVAQFRLNGIISSIVSIPMPSTTHDLLLIAFRDAKMSLVEYSQPLHKLVTISMHSYERDELKRDAGMDRLMPELRVDPVGRCAVMRFYTSKLAVMPIRQDSTAAASAHPSQPHNDTDDTPRKHHPYLPTFVLPFTDIDSNIRHVIDIQFLYGYLEPTLCILYEPHQTWTGRLGVLKDTISIIIVSLDLVQRKYPILYRSDGLPYNSVSVVPVPMPLGGLVVISHNAIIYMDQVMIPGILCMTNGYFDHETKLMPMPTETASHPLFGDPLPAYHPPEPSVYVLNRSIVTEYREMGMVMDGCRGVFVCPDIMLLVLRDGEMVQVELVGDEGVGRSWHRRKGGVRGFRITRSGLRCAPPTCILNMSVPTDAKGSIGVSRYGRGGGVGGAPALCGLYGGPDGYTMRYGTLFVGSRVSDGQVIQYVEVDSIPKRTATVFTKTENDDDIDTGDGDDELDMELYGDTVPSTTHRKMSRQHDMDTNAQPTPNHPTIHNPTHIRYRLCDAVTIGSPFRDTTVGQPASYSRHPFEPSHPACNLDVVSATGDGVHGALCIQSRSIRPYIANSMKLNDLDDVWTVSVSHIRTSDGDTTTPFHTYMVLSQSTSTIVLRADHDFDLFENTDMVVTNPTVHVGTAFHGTCVVQVHPDGITILNADLVRLNELILGNGDDEWIVAASMNDSFIVVQMNTGYLVFCAIEEATRSLNVVGQYNAELVATCCLIQDDGSDGAWMFPTNEESTTMWTGSTMKSGTKPDKRREGASSKPHGDVGDGSNRVSVPDSDHEPIVLDEEIDDEMAEIYGSCANVGGSSASSDDDVDMAQPDQHHHEQNTESTDTDGDAQQPETKVDCDEPLTEFNISRASGEAALQGTTSSTAQQPRHYCVIITETSHFIIISIPDLVERFAYPNFHTLPNLIVDQPGQDHDTNRNLTEPEFEEVLVTCMGRKSDRQSPYLITRTVSSDLVIYKMFVCPYGVDHDVDTTQNISNRLGIRMVRVPHDVATRNLQLYANTDGDKLNVVPKQTASTFIKKQQLKVFRSVGSESRHMYMGVVVTGDVPCWIMMAVKTKHFDLQSIDDDGGDGASKYAKGCLLPQSSGFCSTNMVRVHPMTVDGPMRSFAPLHIIDAPHGFAYINWRGSVRFAQLLEHFNYDYEWPICKVPVGRTIHKIAYHHDLQTYVMATSVPEPFNIPNAQHASAVAAAVIEEKDTLPDSERRVTGIRELADLGPGMYEPTVNRCSIELVSPVTWETVDSVTLGEAEHVTSLEIVELNSKETSSGKKLFVAAGTGFMRSEDLACRGRLHVYDVIDVVPDPNNPLSNRKLKHVHTIEDRSPYTALCTVNGYIVSAIGPKIIMYQLEDGELNGVAFMDINIYAVSLSSVKNMIQICDIHKSVWLAVFQEEPAKLLLLGKDVQPLQCFYGDMLVDESQMAMVVADGEKNLHVMTYAPYNVQSLGGQRLIRRGDMHLGQHITKMIRLKRKPVVRHGTVVDSTPGASGAGINGSSSSGVAAATIAMSSALSPSSRSTIQQHWILAATMDGALVVITPVPEKMYKRLYGLYSRMVSGLEHVAGLNPRGYRQVVHRARPLALTPLMGPPGPRGILDGDIVCMYMNAVSRVQQNALAQAIGSREDRLLDDIVEVLAGIDYF